MTLLELIKLIQRNWKLTVALPVVCAVLCIGVLMVLPATYSAKAVVSVSGEPGGIAGLAEGFVSDAQAETGASVAVKADTTSKTIEVTAEGKDAQSCIDAANDVADKTVRKAPSVYEKVTMTVAKAEFATDTSPSVAKFAIVALLAGLFGAICVIVVIDMVRAPVHGAGELQEALGMRSLGRTGSKQAEREREALLANVRFACGEGNAVSIVPVGSPSYATEVCELGKRGRCGKVKLLVIDADLRSAAWAGGEQPAGGRHAAGVQAPQAKGSLGLTEVLMGRATLAEATERLAEGVALLPSGGASQSPVAALSSPEFAKLLQTAKQRYDLVCVKTTDAAAHADFAYVANATKNTVLAVREMETSTAALSEAVNQLEIASAHVAGFVMTEASKGLASK